MAVEMMLIVDLKNLVSINNVKIHAIYLVLVVKMPYVNHWIMIEFVPVLVILPEIHEFPVNVYYHHQNVSLILNVPLNIFAKINVVPVSS